MNRTCRQTTKTLNVFGTWIVRALCKFSKNIHTFMFKLKKRGEVRDRKTKSPHYIDRLTKFPGNGKYCRTYLHKAPCTSDLTITPASLIRCTSVFTEKTVIKTLGIYHFGNLQAFGIRSLGESKLYSQPFFTRTGWNFLERCGKKKQRSLHEQPKRNNVSLWLFKISQFETETLRIDRDMHLWGERTKEVESKDVARNLRKSASIRKTMTKLRFGAQTSGQIRYNPVDTLSPVDQAEIVTWYFWMELPKAFRAWPLPKCPETSILTNIGHPCQISSRNFNETLTKPQKNCKTVSAQISRRLGFCGMRSRCIDRVATERISGR